MVHVNASEARRPPFPGSCAVAHAFTATLGVHDRNETHTHLERGVMSPALRARFTSGKHRGRINEQTPPKSPEIRVTNGKKASAQTAREHAASFPLASCSPAPARRPHPGLH